jgi:hypothetical protein
VDCELEIGEETLDLASLVVLLWFASLKSNLIESFPMISCFVAP